MTIIDHKMYDTGNLMATQKTDQTDNFDMTMRLKVRIRELTILHDIAQAVTSILDLQNVLNRIVEAAVYLTNAEEGFLMLVDTESNQLHLRAGKGLGDKAAKVMSMPVNDSLAGQVVSTGKPLRMGGNQRDDSYKVKTGYLVKSILNVPIKGQAGVLGVLSVDHAVESFKTFSDHDVSLLTDLAEYAAIAIENARRYEEAARRAEELAGALAEVDVKPHVPTRQADRDALEKFNRGLRHQRTEVAKAQEWILSFSQELEKKIKTAEDIANRLGLWNQEVDSLLPQLDWVAQTALSTKPTGPLAEPVSPDSEIIAILKAILKHLQVGVLLCDAKGMILEANTTAQTILNRPGDALINQALSTLAPKDSHWEHLIGSMRLAMALGRKKQSSPPPSSLTLYQSDRIIKATIIPTGTHRPRGVALVALLTDVSAEMEGWHARDAAITVLSETLRTPMSAIRSYTDLLLGESVGLVTRGQRRYLHRVRQNVEKMEDDLIRATNQPGYYTTLSDAAQASVNDALTEAVELAKEELKQTGVLLTATLAANLPPVQIAPQYLTKIITDLLLRMGAHTQPQDTIEVNTTVQSEGDSAAYLVIGIHCAAPQPYIQQELEQDIDLKAITRAVEYQGGRVWIDIQHDGQWEISLLIPAEI